MRVKVQPMNVKGKPRFSKERERRESFVGELKIFENRLHSLGRAVVTARVIEVLDGSETPLLELYDIAVLWAEAKRLRVRGFEIQESVQYAQTWDIEVL